MRCRIAGFQGAASVGVAAGAIGSEGPPKAGTIGEHSGSNCGGDGEEEGSKI